MSEDVEDSGEHDVYVTQLQEVFNSCDTQGTGRLSEPELHILCTRLQVDDQADALVEKLLADNPDGTVKFEAFKEGFVAVLSESVEDLDVTSSDEDDGSVALGDASAGNPSEVTPKFVKGSKKYGRRSHPYGPSDGTNNGSSPRNASRRPVGKEGTSRSKQDLDDKDMPEGLEDPPYTYEAEGQMNSSIGELEAALDPVSEEQHLQVIWQQLGVGGDGFLTLPQLGTVCDHIGMDEMNDEELQHLFDKLDVDMDGRVSFHEFLHGLFQHGGSGTPTATPVRPPSLPRQKLRVSVMNFEDRPQTPSFITALSGLFSTLDPEGTGYASVEVIVDLWEQLGVTNGQEILEYLEFDTHTKVGLTELSSALEQEMRSVEEDNATYQAAVVSYQHELKHLKTVGDSAEAERDKLKQDLGEANHRIALLVKEGDERQVASDNNWERQLQSSENKYLEQIRALQVEVDNEKEAQRVHSVRQHTQLESEVSRLKEEELRLREKLMHTQRELERLEQDILEMAEKCANMEKVNSRQQRELEEAATLQVRLEDLESSQAKMVDEQSKWQTARLDQLESNSNELKDKNDELTMEVEELRQQLAITRRRGRLSRGQDPTTPHRNGSVLSDYQKPMILRRSSDTVSSEEDDGAVTPRLNRSGRKLPLRPELTSSTEDADKDILPAETHDITKEIEDLRSEVETSRKEKDELMSGHEEKISHLTHSFSLERKDIEQAYKLEITDIEDQYEQDKEFLLKQHEREKVALMEQLELEFQEKLREREAEIERRMEEEKRDILIRVESEKNLLKQQLTEQQTKLRETIRKEFDLELSSKMLALETNQATLLESTVNQDSVNSAALHKRIAELELQLKLEREELELSFQKERFALQESKEQECNSLHNKYRLEIIDIENSLAAGERGLRGKLREDFNNLLEQHRARVATEEQQRAVTLYQSQSQDLKTQVFESKTKQQKDHDLKIENLMGIHQEAFNDLVKRHHTDLADCAKTHLTELCNMEEKHKNLVLKLKKEHEQYIGEVTTNHNGEQGALEEQLARTCEDLITAQACLEKDGEIRKRLEEEIHDMEEKHKKQVFMMREEAVKEREGVQRKLDHGVVDSKERLSAEIKERLEEDFLQQMEQLQHAFGEERAALTAHISLLQNELDSKYEDNKQNAEDQMKERHLQGELETMKRLHDNLRQDKQQTEIRLENLSQHYTKRLQEKDTAQKHLEERIQSLIKDKEELTRTRSPLTTSSPVIIQKADNTILSALARQQAFLESTTGDLRHEIRNLSQTSNKTQSLHQEAPRIQEDLIQELEMTAARVVELETTMALVQSSHQRELHRIEAQMEGMVSAVLLNESRDALVHAERRVAELEQIVKQTANETRKRLKGSEEDHKDAFNKIENDCDLLRRNIDNKQLLLNGQVDKLREQYEISIRRDVLVKDLYVENAEMMKKLYQTERREKEIRSNALKLQDRCFVLENLLEKVTQAALA